MDVLPNTDPSAAPGRTPEAVRVVLDGAADLEFDYAVPPEMAGRIGPGSRVVVPLRNRRATGTVLHRFPAKQAESRYLKPVRELLDGEPVLTPPLLELGRWISSYYVCPMESVMRTLLPPSVRTDQHAPKRRNVIRPGNPVPPDEREALSRKAPRQAAILTALEEQGEPLPASDFSAAAVKALAAKGWIRVESETVDRDPHAADDILPTRELALNPSQSAALTTILEAVRDPAGTKPVLLYGITGSGKTEVYLQAASRVLGQGKSVLVLVPEISLTPQTVERFRSRFASMRNQVAVLHSHLSQGERFDEWHRIRRGEARVVIGARSAVFAPLVRPGLILVDEEHDTSYKQENPPRYHARDVAIVRARIEQCAVVLGSATPSFESWHNALRGRYTLAKLPERADDAQLPIVRVIDMRMEKRRASAGGAPAILSERLRISIDQRLTRGEQVILFLNRRGFAASVLCQACGHVVTCNHCSIPMTLHQEAGRLICHICGFQRLAPRRCPQCADPGILFARFGTERAEETIRRTFPKARVARVDTDSMQQRHRLRDTLRAFQARRIDILIGTQMLAKGLDFPNVTLAGILHADLALHIPDFRSGERTFSLLTQVAGRAGRGALIGEVIVQTYTPHHPAVQFARRHDFEGFSVDELEMRRQSGYPPFGHAVLVTVRSERQNLAEFTIRTLHARLLREIPPDVLMSEPAPSPLEKAHNQYRYQILLRARHTSTITGLLVPAVRGLHLSPEVFVAIDVDPVSLF